MTRQVTERSGISLVPLSSSIEWCNEALLLLQKLADLEEKKETDPQYEYDVMTILAELWQIILRHADISAPTEEDPVSMRMRRFLEYIEEHLDQDISLEEMAASAGVSKTEVLRCFHKTLQTTPYSYVMEARLSKAADLLAETGLPVGEIASRTGFNQQSYFGKRFKEKMGVTPLEYRRKMRT